MEKDGGMTETHKRGMGGDGGQGGQDKKHAMFLLEALAERLDKK